MDWGNPNKFYQTLNENGYIVSFTRSFPDHYNYNYQDINNLILTAKKQNLELITTEKDYVKINNKNKLIHVLSIEMHLSVEDKSKFEIISYGKTKCLIIFFIALKKYLIDIFMIL